MIRARNALFRQVQSFFQSQLIGLYRWDEVSHSRPIKFERPEDYRERKRLEWFNGKTHDKIELQFGPFSLTVLGPFEDKDYPCGHIVARTARETLEGPLDPSTWDRVAAFIKENHQEEELYGTASGTDWGR